MNSETENNSSGSRIIWCYLSNWTLFTLMVIILLPWVITASMAVRGMGRECSSKVAKQTALVPVSKPLARIDQKMAPWGKLLTQDMTIEPGSQLFQMDFPMEHWNQWMFPHRTLDQIRHVFLSSGVTEDLTDQFIDTAVVNENLDGYALWPSVSMIKRLSKDQRVAIYQQAEVNFFIYDGASIDEWFADSGLDPEIIALTKSYIYKRGSNFCFTDMPLVYPEIKSPDQRIRFQQVLNRTRTLNVTLSKVSPEKIDTLLNYWNVIANQPETEMLLTSASRSPTQSIDVVYLLPGFAKSRLYSFPRLDLKDNIIRDCHWASLNFFNSSPDDKLGNTEPLRVTLQNYTPVKGKPIFGDLVLLIDSSKELIHSCVYIADNIVFTKNGPTMSPFIFQKMEAMLSIYETFHGKLRMKLYRKKRLG